MQQAFLNRLRDGRPFAALFERLPGVCFFAKDDRGRLMLGNRLFLEHVGLDDEADLVGMTDRELFPMSLTEGYREDDARVMSTGEPIVDRVELFPNHQGEPDWFLTNKVPLFDRAGAVAGVAGTTQSYEKSRSALQPYLDIAPAVDHIREHFDTPLRIADLADRVHLSVRQFERKFKQIFHTTPQRYLIRMRLHAACERLLRTRTPITQIALGVGFYDHASFTRHFVRHMRLTPSAYRKRARG